MRDESISVGLGCGVIFIGLLWTIAVIATSITLAVTVSPWFLFLLFLL